MEGVEWFKEVCGGRVSGYNVAEKRRAGPGVGQDNEADDVVGRRRSGGEEEQKEVDTDGDNSEEYDGDNVVEFHPFSMLLSTVQFDNYTYDRVIETTCHY